MTVVRIFMKSKSLQWMSLVGALGLWVSNSPAQATNEVEQLKKQMQQLQENFDRVQREHRDQLDTLMKKLDGLVKQQQTEAETKKLEQSLAAELAKNQPAPAPAASPPAWSPAQPLTVARAGSAYMNISFDALMDVGWSTAANPSALLELGDHDPSKRGFSLRNAEISLDGAVDPYFKGFANVVMKLDNNNQTEIELEEAYAQSTSLPANLQLKAGQFFAAFGRMNPTHPHTWAFVDQPIILGRAFGPDGLRSISAQLSWLVPTPFYTEVFLGVLDGQGGTSFSFRNPGAVDSFGASRFYGRATLDRHLSGPGDLVFVPRLASSFELTDHQTLVVGASAAFGPNDTGANAQTQIYGVDLYWKWKPAHADAGFPFVAWQTEALYRRFEAGADPLAPTPLPAETLRDWGFYSQVLWGFKPRWVAGLRGEYANGNAGANDPNESFRGERTRISPVLTYYPSEFSKVRLQYNYDQGALFGTDHSAWLQFEFLLGAHGAHKF
jgi:hypothetical protein